MQNRADPAAASGGAKGGRGAGKLAGRAGRRGELAPEAGEPSGLGEAGASLIRNKVLPASEQFDPELYLRVIHAVRLGAREGGRGQECGQSGGWTATEQGLAQWRPVASRARCCLEGMCCWRPLSMLCSPMARLCWALRAGDAGTAAPAGPDELEAAAV